MDNYIDLGKIYGFNEKPDDRPFGLSDTVILKNIPSLEQIAMYNLASRGGVSQNDMMSQNAFNDTGYPTGVPADINFNDNNEIPTPYVSTPTTALQSSQNISAIAELGTEAGNTAITDFSNPFPVTAESIQYLNGFIRTQIGRRVTVTFLLGSNQLEEVSGYLLGVGANYILLNEINTDDITACDFYNIKFIKFYY